MTARCSHHALPAVLAAMAMVTLALTLVAAGDGVLPGDVVVARWLQEIPLTGTEQLAWFAFWAGSAPIILIVAALLAIVAWRHGYTRLVAIVIGILLLRALNPVLKLLIASPRPTAEQVVVTEVAPEYGFPSGHTMGATLLYGGAIWLARRTIEEAWVRWLVQATAAVVILITGFGRIHTGAHWPSDVLGGFLWGVTGLIFLLATVARWILPKDGQDHPERQRPRMRSGSLGTCPERAPNDHADRDRPSTNGRMRP